MSVLCVLLGPFFFFGRPATGAASKQIAISALLFLLSLDTAFQLERRQASTSAERNARLPARAGLGGGQWLAGSAASGCDLRSPLASPNRRPRPSTKYASGRLRAMPLCTTCCVRLLYLGWPVFSRRRNGGPLLTDALPFLQPRAPGRPAGRRSRLAWDRIACLPTHQPAKPPTRQHSTQPHPPPHSPSLHHPAVRSNPHDARLAPCLLMHRAQARLLASSDSLILQLEPAQRAPGARSRGRPRPGGCRGRASAGYWSHPPLAQTTSQGSNRPRLASFPSRSLLLLLLFLFIPSSSAVPHGRA